MSRRPSTLSIAVKASLGGLLTYGLYKLTVPKEEHIRTVINNSERYRDGDWHRLMELSAQGYSYEAVVKIIQMEKKKKYDKLYEEEKAKKQKELKELEEQKLREAPLFNLPAAVESACQTLLGPTA